MTPTLAADDSADRVMRNAEFTGQFVYTFAIAIGIPPPHLDDIGFRESFGSEAIVHCMMGVLERQDPFEVRDVVVGGDTVSMVTLMLR
jgi:hypothetical protein